MNVDKNSIDIVIATYNGERYIAEQIESILQMDGFEKYVKNIIICDDNSQDRTVDIITSLIPASKLLILENNSLDKNLGPIRNFERGILKSTADFIMLSDQDDVWEKRKLNLYIENIDRIDKETSFVIFSDLEVVDKELNSLSPSFQDYQSIPKDWYKDINNLLIQNTAPGCTMLFNRELVANAFPLPDECIMHDWWLMLVAKAIGEVYFINEPLVKYRQHGKNQVGAKKSSIADLLKNLKNNTLLARKNLYKTLKQMNDLNNRFPKNLSSETKERIKIWNFCFTSDSSVFIKFFKMSSVRLKKSSPIKTLGLYYLLFSGKK